MTDETSGKGDAVSEIHFEPLKTAIGNLGRWLEHDMECPAFLEEADECSCGLREASNAIAPTFIALVDNIKAALAQLGGRVDDE